MPLWWAVLRCASVQRVPRLHFRLQDPWTRRNQVCESDCDGGESHEVVMTSGHCLCCCALYFVVISYRVLTKNSLNRLVQECGLFHTQLAAPWLRTPTSTAASSTQPATRLDSLWLLGKPSMAPPSKLSFASSSKQIQLASSCDVNHQTISSNKRRRRCGRCQVLHRRPFYLAVM